LGKRPAHLYKYQPVTARTLENLQCRRIWFSAASVFNDPFDCAVNVRMKALEADDLKRAWQTLSARGLIAPKLNAAFMTDGEPNDLFRDQLEEVISTGSWRDEVEKARARVGIACLSAKNDDLLMWGHYADGHRGFCLEFDASTEPFSKALAVAYQDTEPEMSPLDVLDHEADDNERVIRAMLSTKHTCWRYEQEWRLIHEQSSVAFQYPAESLTRLYIGASMPSGMKAVIAQLLHGASVELFEMKRGSGGFTVEAVAVQ